MDDTSVALQACTIVTRRSPALALLAAAFAAELDSPQIIVSRHNDYRDVNPTLWTGTRTVLFIDVLRFDLVAYDDKNANALFNAMRAAGHDPVFFTTRFSVPDEESDRYLNGCRVLTDILFPEASEATLALATAADYVSFDTPAPDEFSRQATAVMKELLCNDAGEMHDLPPRQFAEVVSTIARKVKLGI